MLLGVIAESAPDCTSKGGPAPGGQLRRPPWLSRPRWGHGASVEPVVSAAGRSAAFSSVANNLVPGDTNGVEDPPLEDHAAVADTCLDTCSPDLNGCSAAEGVSMVPVRSAAGGDLRRPLSGQGEEVASANPSRREIVRGTHSRAANEAGAPDRPCRQGPSCTARNSARTFAGSSRSACQSRAMIGSSSSCSSVGSQPALWRHAPAAGEDRSVATGSLHGRSWCANSMVPSSFKTAPTRERS